MYALGLKKWSSHLHFPDRHQMALEYEELMHNKRFWLITSIVVAAALLLTIGIWAAIYGNPGRTTSPIPFYPYAV